MRQSSARPIVCFHQLNQILSPHYVGAPRRGLASAPWNIERRGFGDSRRSFFPVTPPIKNDSGAILNALETYLHCNLMSKKPEKKLTGIPKITHPHRSALVSEPSDF